MKKVLTLAESEEGSSILIIGEIKDLFPYSIVSPMLLHCKCENFSKSLLLTIWIKYFN